MEARIYHGKVFVFIYSLLAPEPFTGSGIHQRFRRDTTAHYMSLSPDCWHHWESQHHYEVTAVELKPTPDWQVLQRKHSPRLQLFDYFFIWRHR